VSSRASCCGLLCVLTALAVPAAAEDWLPVSPDELQMTSVPEAPGAPAVYLYRQVDRDDSRYFERIYVRIKVLTEAGLKYANVELPFIKDVESVRNIQARTIRPDGSAAKFDGTVYEKPIVKTDRLRYLAKAFTLPEAEVGSILEYRYEHDLPNGWIFDSRWVLSEDLFTRLARFSLVPNGSYSLIWSWPLGLPPGTEAPKSDRGRIHLETHNVPAVVTEEHMPPEDEVRMRVDFIYDASRTARNDPVAFWKAYDKRTDETVERFCDRRRAMSQAVAQITSAGDPPETRVRKLYARVQQIHNLSYASDSEREARHEDAASITSVEEVWNRGYGNGQQITWLFLALVRAAGVEASDVTLATRDRYFFSSRFMNPTELNTHVVLVRLDGRDLFLDPGVPFTPFGLLPWYETNVDGLKLDKDGGTWVHTPYPAATDSRIERHGTFRFENGALDGKVTVTYRGLEASWRRLEELAGDDGARRQFLERDLEGYIPTGVTVKLTNSPDWNGWDTPLIAEYDLEIPGWAAPAGRRALLPIGLFSAGEKHTFEAPSRVHGMYFDYCNQHLDDVTIEIPGPWALESIPGPATLDLKGLVFRETVDRQGTALHVARELTLNVLLVDPKIYDTVHRFYQNVRTADEAQAVLAYGKPARK